MPHFWHSIVVATISPMQAKSGPETTRAHTADTVTDATLLNLQEYPHQTGFQVRSQYTLLLAYVQPPEGWTERVGSSTYRVTCDSHSCPAYKITFTPLDTKA